MSQYKYLLILPVIFSLKLSLCQNSQGLSNEIYCSKMSREITIDDSNHNYDFCDYFYTKDSINDTLYFDFEDREDFGPVYLSDYELKQIYCEIKRGDVRAYTILYLHYFYSHSQHISRSDLDKLICITDFLALKYHYYRGYLICGNYIFDYLEFNADDYYAATMITYYEKYFESTQSKAIAKKLYEIFCGDYSFFKQNSTKANYYKEFISDK